MLLINKIYLSFKPSTFLGFLGTKFCIYTFSNKKIMKQNQEILAKFKFYDIAANLTDPQFGDGAHHVQDRHEVIQRARNVGCTHLLIAAGCIQDATHSFDLCNKYQNCYATIGVHPCRAKQPFDETKAKSVKQYFQKLQKQLNRIESKVVAIGECGLDYDRLEWSTKQHQLQVFPYHFDLAQKYKLPMYLHNRNTGDDFYDIVKKNRHRFPSGVVHSFTGSKEEVDKIIELDLYIGINGCSLKTQENLQVLKYIPVDRMMLQTDCPYCQIRNSHAASSFIKTKFPSKAKNKKRQPNELIKGRNQPCKIIQVLQAVSGVLKRDPEQLAKIAFENSIKMFTK